MLTLCKPRLKIHMRSSIARVAHMHFCIFDHYEWLRSRVVTSQHLIAHIRVSGRACVSHIWPTVDEQYLRAAFLHCTIVWHRAMFALLACTVCTQKVWCNFVQSAQSVVFWRLRCANLLPDASECPLVGPNTIMFMVSVYMRAFVEERTVCPEVCGGRGGGEASRKWA